jgi:hypothetical protein
MEWARGLSMQLDIRLLVVLIHLGLLEQVIAMEEVQDQNKLFIIT